MEKIKDKRYLTAVAIATACVVVLALWRPAAVESVFPFDRLRIGLRTHVLPAVAGVFRGAAASAENERLRREVGALALARDDANRLVSENAALRKALEFKERTQGSWIPAEVLSANCGSAGVRQLVRLSKGSADGVVRGAVAVVPDGLVGRVVSVTPHTAAVMLVSDPALRVACEIETESGVRAPRGILCGGDGDRLELRYLTQAAGLAASRQRIVTSGLGGVFPRGIPVGCLEDLADAVGSVKLAADLTSLEFMFIRREN